MQRGQRGLEAQEPTHDLEVQLVEVLKGHSSRVWCVSWCPTAQVLASASGDHTVKLWSAGTEGWKCIATLEGEHNKTVRHVSWSPTGEYIAAASFDGTVSVWKKVSVEFDFEVEGTLDGQESEIKCVEWMTDSTLATCSRDHTVWVWDRVEEGEYECAGVLTGHSQDVKHCVWYLPVEGRPLLISCSYDDTIRVWSDESHRQDDWHCVQTLQQHTGTVWCAAFQRTGERTVQEDGPVEEALMATCSEDRTVMFWRRDGNGMYQRVAVASGVAERPLFSVDWAPQGTPVAAAACGDNSVLLLSLWEDHEGVHVKQERVCEAHESDVNSVSFSHFGSLDEESGVWLASGGDDEVIKIWRVKRS